MGLALEKMKKKIGWVIFISVFNKHLFLCICKNGCDRSVAVSTLDLYTSYAGSNTRLVFDFRSGKYNIAFTFQPQGDYRNRKQYFCLIVRSRSENCGSYISVEESNTRPQDVNRLQANFRIADRRQRSDNSRLESLIVIPCIYKIVY